MNIAGISEWFFSLLAGSMLLTWIFNSSKGSILICAVFHATIDIVFVSEMADKTITNYLGIFITLWGIISIFVYGYKNLSRNNKVTARPIDLKFRHIQ